MKLMGEGINNQTKQVSLASEPPSPPRVKKSKFQDFLDSRTTRVLGTIILFILAFLTAISFGFIVGTIKLN